jgi:DNA-binding NarL/FixJ family response regulator
MAESRIRVLLVDDHILLRKGLASVLTPERGFEVVGEASDGQEALERAQTLMPDLILMDIYMPGMSGLEATRRIKAVLPHVKIVILTVSEEDKDLFEAIKGGAQGYILKKIAPRALCTTLKSVFQGEASISGRMAAKILGEFARQGRQPSPGSPPTTNLSAREKEVLKLVSQGKSNKEIAAALAIAESTVKGYLKSILEKLHVENRVQAATFALREGLIEETRGQAD